MIKIACAGFPVGRKQYEEKFQTVELKQMFDKFPRAGTVQKWRDEAPEHFEFIVCASKIITHQPKTSAHSTNRHRAGIGSFHDSASVRQAAQQTLSAAETLKSRLIFFQLPSQFTPHPDNIRRLQTFFSSNKSNQKLFAWETPANWPVSLVEKLSADHRLMPVLNPLGRKKPSAGAPMRYFRLGSEGRTSGVKQFTKDELKAIKNACDLPLCYVVFNNGPSAFEDALRLRELIG